MNAEYKEFQYAPLQFRMAFTGEVFNIGVIVTDEFEVEREIRTITKFDSIAKCLRLTEISSHNYMLDHLLNNFSKDGFLYGREYSNSIYIQKLDWVSSDKDLKQTADFLFDELVTLKKVNNSGRTISQHTSTKVVTRLKKYAEDKDFERAAFRRELAGTFSKKIDMIIYSEVKHKHQNNLAVIGVDVVTTAVDTFLKDAAFSAMSLKGAKDLGSIKKAVAYLPNYDDFRHVNRADYKKAKESIKGQGITVIDTSDEEEFFGEVNKLAIPYKSALF